MAKLGFAKSKQVKHSRQSCLRRTLRFESLEDRWVLAPVTVNTLTDVQDSPNLTSISALISNPGPDGKISLREAIVAANADSAQDTISFSVIGTINLTNLGQLTISKNLVINGPGSSQLTIRAFDPTPTQINGDGNRIFNVADTTNGSAPPQVEIIGLTLTGADIAGFFPSQGGAIRSEGLLTLRQCTIVDNHAETGGGIFVEVAGGSPSTQRDILRIEDSVIDNNHAFNGAGVFIVSGSLGAPTSDKFTITRTTLSHNETIGTGSPNETIGDGGGIFGQLFGAELAIADSTLKLNKAVQDSGGGVHVALSRGAALNVSQSMIELNSAGLDGGGISAKAFGADTAAPIKRSITIAQSTISGNTSAQRGGGLFFTGTNLSLRSTAIRDNHAASGLGGGIGATFALAV